MIDGQLLELIHSRRLWAFIGAGVAADAGLPSWKSLIESILEEQDKATREKIEALSNYKIGIDTTKPSYDKCLSAIQEKIGRDRLEDYVRKFLPSNAEPGELGKLIAELPFEGYITTNYNNIIENALKNLTDEPWLAVGNTDEEIRKISGDPNQLVWHLHGSIVEKREKSKLIITKEDYDREYLQDSKIKRTLFSLLKMKRVVFIGFSFDDYEIKRILETVRQEANPSKSFYAFLGKKEEEDKADIISDLEKYNMLDIKSYAIRENSHKSLLDILEVYKLLSYGRSLKLKQPIQSSQYDPKTMGLQIYNALCLENPPHQAGEVIEGILFSRILALLESNDNLNIQDVKKELENRRKVITGDYSDQEGINTIVTKVLEIGIQKGYIEIENEIIRLSDKGLELVKQQAAEANKIKDYFTKSIEQRLISLPNDLIDRISDRAIRFIDESLDKRALGIAKISYARDQHVRDISVTKLIDYLRPYMVEMETPEEVNLLAMLVIEILINPNEKEEDYIGFNLQASFAKHIMGLDEETLQLRINEIRNTAFLLDSHVIIPLLARSSQAHETEKALIDGLKEYGSCCITTDLLAYEVSLHVIFALKNVDKSTGCLNEDSLAISLGKNNNRQNALMEGFEVELVEGQTKPSFHDYLSEVTLGVWNGGFFSAKSLEKFFEKEKILCKPFDEFDGFSDLLFDQRREKQDLITKSREKYGSYRGDPKQTKAEAEAIIIIKKLRDGSFSIEGKKYSKAFFVSHSRFLNDFTNEKEIITIRPEGVLHLLATLKKCDMHELRIIANSLIWDLKESGINIVNKKIISGAFKPFLDSSKEGMEEALNDNRFQTIQRYGVDPDYAYRTAGDYEIPFVLSAYYKMSLDEKDAKITKLKKEVNEEKSKRVHISSTLSERERSDYERLKAEKKARKKKVKKRKASLKSDPKRIRRAKRRNRN